MLVLYVTMDNLFLLFSPDQLGQSEEKGKGSLPWSVYGVYIQAAGGPLAFFFIMILFIMNVGSVAFNNWWLSYWIKAGSGVRTGIIIKPIYFIL